MHEWLNAISKEKANLTIKRKLFSTQSHTHNRFMALFLGPPMWAGARRELLDFMVQWKINRGRYTNHLARCHSIWTNQCPPVNLLLHRGLRDSYAIL